MFLTFIGFILMFAAINIFYYISSAYAKRRGYMDARQGRKVNTTFFRHYLEDHYSDGYADGILQNEDEKFRRMI